MKQGVKAVISKSFERIHRSNLVGMGLIPLCFKQGEDADTLGLTGFEKYTILMPTDPKAIKPGMDIVVKTDNGKEFKTTLRFDTQVSVSLSVLVRIFQCFKQMHNVNAPVQHVYLPLLDPYIGECMVSTTNINDGIKELNQGYQICNTSQISIFDGYLNEEESLNTRLIFGLIPF